MRTVIELAARLELFNADEPGADRLLDALIDLDSDRGAALAVAMVMTAGRLLGRCAPTIGASYADVLARLLVGQVEIDGLRRAAADDATAPKFQLDTDRCRGN